MLVSLRGLEGFKMESVRKLSSFSFQWTKTLYQGNLNINYCILFYIFFSRATCIDIISQL